MRNLFTISMILGIILTLLFSPNVSLAQARLIDISLFDAGAIALGMKEDSLMLADEINYQLQQIALKKEKLALASSSSPSTPAAKQPLNSAMRTASPEATTSVNAEKVAEAAPMPAATTESRKARLAEFPAHIAKKVPENAVFLHEETGEGIAISELGANSTMLLIEDKYAEKLTVRFEKLRVALLSVRVYGIDGRLVYKTRVTNKPKGYEFDIDIKNWTKGIYRFQLKVDDGRWEEKVLVKNTQPKQNRR